MPRRPREVIEGAVYHLYNRFARGAPLFASADDAERFVARVRQARDRDGLAVLAWCLMSNHDHLAVRIGPVPLARSMGVLQSRFAADLNRRRRASGPRWQSRYKAKIGSDERHLYSSSPTSRRSRCARAWSGMRPLLFTSSNSTVV